MSAWARPSNRWFPACPSPEFYPKMAQPSLTLTLLSVLIAGCDLFPVDDDLSGDPVVTLSSSGSLARLFGGDEGVTVGWTATVASGGTASVVADGSDLFVASSDEIHAFALADAVEHWVWNAPSDIVALAGPLDDAVYVMTLDSVIALEAADGGERWTLDFLGLGGVADDAIAAGAGAVFLGGDPLRKVDPVTGAILAEVATGGDAVSQIVVASGSVFVGLADGVGAFDPGTLAQLWHHGTTGEVDHLALSATAVAYSVLGDGVGALATQGNPLWSAESGEVIDGLAIGDNLVVAGRSDGTLLALDEAAGTELWAVPANATPIRDLAVSGQTLFVADGGFVEGLNLGDGSSLWEWTPQGNPMVLGAF